jgi:hypothetical protein
MGKGEVALEAILLWGMKKVSSGDGDTLRRSALNRASGWGCGRVMSCSGDQERWRTKLELCRGESFDDDHRSAAVGTAPQGVQGWSERSDSACGGTAWRAAKHSGRSEPRLRLARKPKWRMRMNPLGSR